MAWVGVEVGVGVEARVRAGVFIFSRAFFYYFISYTLNSISTIYQSFSCVRAKTGMSVAGKRDFAFEFSVRTFNF